MRYYGNVNPQLKYTKSLVKQLYIIILKKVLKINTHNVILTRLDTISLTTSTDYIQSMDMSRFTHSEITKSNGLKIVNYTLEKKTNGINNISVNKTNDKVTINISSKILGIDYPKGICIETLEQTHSAIGKTGLVLNDEFLYNSTLKFVDIKNDLNLSLSNKIYIHALINLIAPKFIKTDYPDGVVFNELAQCNPIRFTGYNKEIEIKKDKIFYKQFPTLEYNFSNVLRLETRLPKRSTIKKYLINNNLIDVLNFKNLNHKVLTKIIGEQNYLKPIYNTLDMTNTQEKNYAHISYLNNIYNGDFNRIKEHIKGKLGKKTKASYQIGIAKKYLKIINAQKNENAMQYIYEILTALKED